MNVSTYGYIDQRYHNHILEIQNESPTMNPETKKQLAQMKALYDTIDWLEEQLQEANSEI